MKRRSITIVGASLAGVRAAEALRRDGFDGPITLIGDELHLPYDRPPLSKQFLAGEWGEDRLALTQPDRLAEFDLDLRLGVRAVSFDLATRRLGLSTASDSSSTIGSSASGSSVSDTLVVDGLVVDGLVSDTLVVDGLVVATGARCRTLPGTEGLAGVFVLRSLDDSLAIRAAFEAGPSRVVVVGAGFIGSEVAATARTLGLDVTMIESLPQPLSRVLGEELGAVCAQLHRDHGVDLRTGVGVEAVEGDRRVERVRLSDGSVIDADVVVVGIGVVPNTEWLAGSGLEIDDGVVCDATCLAAPGVTAAGDAARWPNQRFGEVMRVEHWDNAVAQGAHAARRLLVGDDEAEPFVPVPWFWSDQFDAKLQIAGLGTGYDRIVSRGAVGADAVSFWYFDGESLLAVDAINDSRSYMVGKRLLETGKTADPDILADPSSNLKRLLR